MNSRIIRNTLPMIMIHRQKKELLSNQSIRGTIIIILIVTVLGIDLIKRQSSFSTLERFWSHHETQ